MKDYFDGLVPFPAWSVTLARPLQFFREPFSSALSHHAALLDEHAGRICRLARELATSFEPHLGAVDVVAIVEAHRNGVKVRAELRGDAAFYVSRYRGVVQQLLLRPQGSRMPVIVLGWGAVSLHMGRVTPRGRGFDEHTFEIESRELVVEPLGQEHTKADQAPLLITRWRHPDGVARYAWVPIPPEPASDPEAISRVLARYDVLIHQRLQAFLEDSGEESDPLIVLMSIPTHGDSIDVMGRRDIGPMTSPFTNIECVLLGPRARGYVPLLVVLGLKAALCWIALDPADETEAPSTMFESANLPQPAATDLPKDEPPEAPAALPERSPAYVLESIFRACIYAEIDESLSQMSKQELDDEVAMAGFDPHVERALGPGLRQTVLEAIMNRRDATSGGA